jgi:hypothetical protein
VLGDWTDGRVDGQYDAACYLEAIEILPEDVRAYTSAADDIARALQARRTGDTEGERTLAGVEDPEASAAGHDGSVRAVPPALVGLAGVAFVVLAAGMAGLVLRRVRVRRRA